MSNVEGLSHLVLYAPDGAKYSKTVEFYRLLGFESIHASSEDEKPSDPRSGEVQETWISLFGTDMHQDLIIKIALREGAQLRPRASDDVNWQDEESALCLVAKNIEAVERQLKQLKVSYQRRESNQTAPAFAEIYLRDPLNNVLTFTNKPHPVSTSAPPSLTSTSKLTGSGDASLTQVRLDKATGKRKKIGVLTSGGDSPGMNAVVRAVARVGIARGCDIYAVYEGYEGEQNSGRIKRPSLTELHSGLVKGGDMLRKLEWDDVRGFLSAGGTLIGTARSMPFRTSEGRLKAARNLISNGIDALIVCGGDGSLTGADVFRAEWPGLCDKLVEEGHLSAEAVDPYRTLTIVGLVGSIDNDMASTDITIGAVTSLHRICESVDSISATALSHSRAFVVEVMGRHCGWLALMAGISTGADFVFIPERPPAEGWEQTMCDNVKRHRQLGKRKTIVIIAEGAIDQNLNPIKPAYIAEVLTDRLGLDTRVTTLGHVQRGGAPAFYDRYLGTVQGIEAIEAVLRSTPETESPMIGMNNNKVAWKPLMESVERVHDYAAYLSSSSYEDDSALLPPSKRMRIGIMHIGAPAGGMNAATRVAVRRALSAGHTPIAIMNGCEGLMRGAVEELGWMSVDGWQGRAGSELGTNRTQPSVNYGLIAYQLQKFRIDGLLIIGGFEAFTAMMQFEQNRKSYPAFQIPIAHLPATVSNNVPGTDFSLGSDTALNAIVESCDALVQSANASRRRVFVVEVQGGKTGYLAVMAGLAVGATTVYIPEVGVNLSGLQEDVQHLVQLYKGDDPNKSAGRIILRNESVSKTYTTDVIASIIDEEGGTLFDSKTTVLGHIQQGSITSPFDRIRATRLAVKGIEFLEEYAADGLLKRAEDAVFTTREQGGLSNVPESAATVGFRGTTVVFTPVQELLKETDLKNRKGLKSWWLSFKGLVEVLTKRVSETHRSEEWTIRDVENVLAALEPPNR
ncbi:hypothetical protein BZG36_04159, partial [Bifiguratus adelaidae]